jgi:hypothetical protein
MTEPIDPSPEIERVADLLSNQRPEVRDLFCYALVLAMIDDEKARVLGRRAENGQEWLTIKTIACDLVKIMRPPISEEAEAQLMRRVGAMVEEDSND